MSNGLTALALDVGADDIQCYERVQLALVIDFDGVVANEQQHGLDGVFFEHVCLCGSTCRNVSHNDLLLFKTYPLFVSVTSALIAPLTTSLFSSNCNKICFNKITRRFMPRATLSEPLFVAYFKNNLLRADKQGTKPSVMFTEPVRQCSVVESKMVVTRIT